MVHKQLKITILSALLAAVFAASLFFCSSGASGQINRIFSQNGLDASGAELTLIQRHSFNEAVLRWSRAINWAVEGIKFWLVRSYSVCIPFVHYSIQLYAPC